MTVILVPPSYLNSHSHQVQVDLGGRPSIGTSEQIFLTIDHLPHYLNIYSIDQAACAYIGRANLSQNIWGMGEIEQWVADNCQGVVLAQFGNGEDIVLYFEDGHTRATEFVNWVHQQRRRTQFILRLVKRNLLEEMKLWLKKNGTGKIDFMKRGNTIAIADQRTAAKFYLVFSDNVEELP